MSVTSLPEQRRTEFVWYASRGRKIEVVKFGGARFLVRCQRVLSRQGRALTTPPRASS
jgi:hypothetical protein